MWGLYYNKILDFDSRTLLLLLEEPSQYMIPIFLSGIFSALGILFSSLVSLVSANKCRIGRKEAQELGNQSIGLGILMIIFSIIYIIAINITMNNYIEYLLAELLPYYTIPEFWDVYNPGFAIIAPFLGGALSIIGGIACRYIKPTDEVISIEEKKDFIVKMPTEPITRQTKYCPQCGQKLTITGIMFCGNCGFELKS